MIINQANNKNEIVHRYSLKKDCSIYIIEGVGGNNYYVSTRDKSKYLFI